MYYIIIQILLYIGFILAIITIAHILRQQRTAGGTAAWLLLIIFIPYIGIPLYFIFSGRKTKNLANKKIDIKLKDSNIVPLKDANSFDKLLRTYNIPGATTGNRLSLCNTGEEAYAKLVELIESAKKSIYLLTFILAEDEVGEDIVNRLARKAADGLCVRILLDGLGSMKTKMRFLEPVIKAGGEIDFFIPVVHRPFHGRANLRNHRKMLIADEKRVMAGGTNIAVEYIGPKPNPGRWKDLSFILEGPAVKHYVDIFISDWKYATEKEIKINNDNDINRGENEGSTVQIVPSGPDVPGDPMYDAILTSAFSAKERLWIVTPYFVPNETLSQALLLTAHRGIDLKIIVPKKSNHKTADIARGTYLREIQKAGGEILLYTGGMVHAKIMIMDNTLAMIGSANIDMRSLFLNYEVAMFTYDADDILATEKWIETLIAGSGKGVADVNAIREMAGGIIRIISPLL